jgi:hypothetical protein
MIKPNYCNGGCTKYNNHCKECSHATYVGKKNGFRWTFESWGGVQFQKKNEKGRYEIIIECEVDDYLHDGWKYFNEWHNKYFKNK